jgi:WhiB family redox-sensing transcriptional regulator
MTLGHQHPRPETVTWRDDAACRGMDPHMFVPDKHVNVAADAKAACASCPVRDACLEHALAHEPHGYWGGMSERDRRRILRLRRKAAS